MKADIIRRSSQVLFDDIGSYPLPKGIVLKSLSCDQYLELVRNVFLQKIDAGVQLPTYPQFRNMIKMFLEPIENPQLTDSPYLIQKESAEILELKAVPIGKNIRVCVTGPLELYISAFGATNYTDILFSLAQSVARYLEKAKEDNKMTIASIDEPSLGLRSDIVFSSDEVFEALEIASAPCKGMYCEVHLHSPLYADLCARTSGINIVGVESAAHPDYLDLIDKNLLEDTDTFLRAGIARTDILSMVANLNDLRGINLWDDMNFLEREIFSLESPEIMLKRLKRTHSKFGERLLIAGPDCGLGSWPSQEMAARILMNCASAIKSFNIDREKV